MSYTDLMSKAVRSWLCHQPESCLSCIQCHTEALDGDLRLDRGKRSEIGYDALYLQTWGKTDDLVAGFIILQFHNWLGEGHAKMLSIEVGEEPSADAQSEENQSKLERLPAPFKADLWCGRGIGDGALTVPPSPFGLGLLPLEVGTCDPRTLWYHLNCSRGFARWPYGSRYIYAYGIDHETWEKHLMVNI